MVQKRKKQQTLILLRCTNNVTINRNTINEKDLVLVSRWDASESRVELQMFTSRQLIIESIRLWTVADVVLYLVDVGQYTVHDQTITITA